MRFVITLLVIVLAAILVGFAVHQDSGYVLIAYNHTTIETTLWFGLLCFIAVVAVVVLVLAVFRRLRYFNKTHRARRGALKYAKSQRFTQNGLGLLADGQFKRAAVLLKKGGRNQPTALVNYVAGAFAAQAQGDTLQRDQLFTRAQEKLPSAKTLIQLAQAQCFNFSGESARALTILQAIVLKQPGHPVAQYMMLKASIEACAWHQAWLALMVVTKKPVCTPAQLAQLTHQVVVGCLNHYPMEALADVWASLQKPQQQDVALISLYVTRLIEAEAFEAAIDVLMASLKRSSQDVLWSLLSECVAAAPEKIANFCDKQRKKYGHTAAALYCAALAAQALGQVDLAKAYLQQSVDIQPTTQALLKLAKLYQSQGQAAHAQAAVMEVLNHV